MPPKSPPPPPPLPTAAKVEPIRVLEPYAIPGIDVHLWRMSGPTRPGVPTPDPGYQFREDLVRELAWSIWPHDGGKPSPSLLVGPKGSGKTSLVLQIAAHCNVPVYRVNLNVGTTTRHLFGRVAAEKGGTFYVPGVAVRAVEEGAWLLLDEVSGATPAVALSLFPVLEPDGAVWLEEGQPPRYANRHPDFRMFATDNTIGVAQEDTRFDYAGTNPDVNAALLDRFGSTLQVDYMSSRQEFAAAKAVVPDMDDVTLACVIKIADSIRKSTNGPGFSSRMVIDWSRRIAAGWQDARGKRRVLTSDEVLAAADAAFLRKMRSREERNAIGEVARRVFRGVEGD